MRIERFELFLLVLAVHKCTMLRLLLFCIIVFASCGDGIWQIVCSLFNVAESINGEEVTKSQMYDWVKFLKGTFFIFQLCMLWFLPKRIFFKDFSLENLFEAQLCYWCGLCDIKHTMSNFINLTTSRVVKT